MVAADDYRRVLIELLRLDPLYKLKYLLVGTGYNVGVLVAGVLVLTQVAHPAVLEMRIDREHREVERLRLGSKIQYLLLREIKQLLVFVSPPDLVTLRDIAVLHRIYIVEYLIVAVTREILRPAAEDRVGTYEELLVVALFREDVAYGRGTGIESILRAGSVADLLHSGKACGLGDHRARSECRAVQ